MVLTLGKDFKPDFTQHPLDLSGLYLPDGWQETKWRHEIVINVGDDYESIDLVELIKRVFGPTAELAAINSGNDTNGRQMFFGVNPESKPGNIFTSWLYRERGGGGATIVAFVRMPDGRVLIALLFQDRPLLFQDGQVIQVIGGYPVKMVGTADQIHKATFSEELDELAKFKVSQGSVREVGARHNSNKAMFITGRDEGISVQLVELPYELLVQESESTWKLNRDLVDIETDRTLEGISRETFFVLNDDLIVEVSKPSSGASACAHTELAVRRAQDVLIKGLPL